MSIASYNVTYCMDCSAAIFQHTDCVVNQRLTSIGAGVNELVMEINRLNEAMRDNKGSVL